MENKSRPHREAHRILSSEYLRAWVLQLPRQLGSLWLFSAVGLLMTAQAAAPKPASPIVTRDIVFEERGGLVAVEAEHFFEQTLTQVRGWYLFTSESTPVLTPDADPSHVAGASGGAYLEILPDTRRNQSETLISGENFSNEPGKMAILSYKVYFSNPGKYYVWARVYSTGPEDNGLHVGIDGQWPDSGQRLQWTAKNQWFWNSKQRTAEVHGGERYKLFLDVPTAGEHIISFSMREDGFEFDKWLMTSDRDFVRPEGLGPASVVRSGKLPKPFPFVAVAAPQTQAAAKPKFPAHWGAPPAIQTMDYRPLPGGYGQGSSTLASWIEKNLAKDAVAAAAGVSIDALDFFSDHTDFYVDRERFLAVNPEKDQGAQAEIAFPYPSGVYNVTLFAAGENDGESIYAFSVGDTLFESFVCPLGAPDKILEEGPRFNRTWTGVVIEKGKLIRVTAKIGSKDGQEHSRARWSKLAFVAADEETKTALASLPAGRSESTSLEPLVLPRQPNGDGSVNISGELRQWHKVTVTLNGPYAHERDNAPNPFTDYRMTVVFEHESGEPTYSVPGYFAADGDAGNSSADSGTQWRAHLSPDKTGDWSYRVEMVRGDDVAILRDREGVPMPGFDGKTGMFKIGRSNKKGRDFRGQGRLEYVGRRYLQFAASEEYFLKAGPDAPETLLGFVDFDGTVTRKTPLKTWAAHLKDWTEGDPQWKHGQGKGLIGALNYLASKGINAFSFLSYNAGGDGDNVWPFVERNEPLHYDCSKLDQWQMVFDHAQALGLYLHFKMQEQENDDSRRGDKREPGSVPTALNDGTLGIERMLYCRELISRFGHELALNWNLGEENTQSTQELRDMAQYIHDVDPYHHHIVVHTFPNAQDRIYPPLLGDQSALTGASLQNSWSQVHQRTLKWVNASAEAGKPWVVANDEQNPAGMGVPPDPGYEGHDGYGEQGGKQYNLHDIRKLTLWGNLMAGGGGVEYYFGYKLPQNDLVCEDYRSRDRSWDYCRIALEFFPKNKIPFWEMANANALIGNQENNNTNFCLAKEGKVYLVYLTGGGTTDLDLANAEGKFRVRWFNPREGGKLLSGSVTTVRGGSQVALGEAPSDVGEDWLIVVRK